MEMMENIFYTSIVIVVFCAETSEGRQGLYPNVPLQGTDVPEFTQPGNLFVYNWSSVEQASYPGNVTALEYCYEMRNRISQEGRTIFTLLLLDSLYGIIQMVNVSNVTTDNCAERGGVMTCCTRQQLTPKQQFQVPGSLVAAFGIFSETGVDTILAFRESSVVRSVVGFQFNANARIINNRISVSQNDNIIMIQYRMFNFIIDNSSTAPSDGSEDSIPITGTTSQPPVIPGDPPTTQITAIDTTLIIEIVIGCLLALVFIAAVAMWIYLCFKARALQRRSKMVSEKIERNSQLIYEVIPEGLNDPMVPPNIRVLQHAAENRQQEQRVYTTPNTIHDTVVTKLVHNLAYNGTNLAHMGQVSQQETIANMERNPAYLSSQERLH